MRTKQWYAVHVMNLRENIGSSPDNRPRAEESILVVKASSRGKAERAARRTGKLEAKLSRILNLGDGEVYQVTFMGIRKVEALDEKITRPGHGTIVTYIEYDVQNISSPEELISKFRSLESDTNFDVTLKI